MDTDFYGCWFRGFEESLDNIGEQDRNTILKHCGRACSDSHTRQIYLDEHKNAADFSDFLSRLQERFPEAEFRVNNDNTVNLEYKYCGCDLVKNGYISSPVLCECSRQSLLYNWGSIFGESKVSVELKNSILGGNDRCRFEITVKDPGNGKGTYWQ